VAFARQLLQVAAQERVEYPPLATGVVLDDPGASQGAKRLVGDVGRQPVVELGGERDALSEPLCVAAERSDVRECLLVLETVGG
jgi:hypothetical protein